MRFSGLILRPITIMGYSCIMLRAGPFWDIFVLARWTILQQRIESDVWNSWLIRINYLYCFADMRAQLQQHKEGHNQQQTKGLKHGRLCYVDKGLSSMKFFTDLRDSIIYEDTKPVHKECLMYHLTRAIQKDLDAFVKEWNTHNIQVYLRNIWLFYLTYLKLKFLLFSPLASFFCLRNSNLWYIGRLLSRPVLASLTVFVNRVTEYGLLLTAQRFL